MHSIKNQQDIYSQSSAGQICNYVQRLFSDHIKTLLVNPMAMCKNKQCVKDSIPSVIKHDSSLADSDIQKACEFRISFLLYLQRTNNILPDFNVVFSCSLTAKQKT